MGLRRRSREAALQLLYQSEFDEPGSKTGLARFWAARKPDGTVREYADRLVQGILDNREELDGLIQSVAKNWRIARMPIIDRNILRIAAYELRYELGLDPAVAINEAIEIAKSYSGQEAAMFINGVLDGVRKSIKGLRPEIEEDHAPKKGQGIVTRKAKAQRAGNPGAVGTRRRKGE